jgi:hypothetical protein
MGLSVGSIVITFVHLFILSAHFQMTIYGMKNKSYGVSEAQLSYVLSLVFAQILVSYVFISGADES